MGDHDQSQTDEADHVIAPIISIHIHSNYNPNNHDNDIALLKMKRPMTFKDHIQPICIPSYGALKYTLLTNLKFLYAQFSLIRKGSTCHKGLGCWLGKEVSCLKLSALGADGSENTAHILPRMHQVDQIHTRANHQKHVVRRKQRYRLLPGVIFFT
jgi:hypothetical protein